MTTLLSTLLGDIPRIHQRGMVVISPTGEPAIVWAHVGSRVNVLLFGSQRWDPASYWSVDLREKTSRAGAAWWLNARRDQVTFLEQYLVDAAMSGAEMTPEDTDTLARLVLRLAGRTP